jgi:DNA modification methylase
MIKFLQGDCIEQMKTLPDESVHCVVTSPPYWGLRDYGVAGQLGLEPTPEEYVVKMVSVFREVRRVLRDDGTLWLNLGDSYSSGGRTSTTLQTVRNGKGDNSLMSRPPVCDSFKPKDLVGIPWMVAFALRKDGWYLRQDIIWAKPNPMPESVTDRCTKSHEYIFLLTKSAQYYYDADAIKEETVTNDDVLRDRETTKLNNVPGRKRMEGLVSNNYETRNKRSVWTVTTQPYAEAHFATFPPDLIRPMVLAGCPITGTILDPFGGAGTTGLVAEEEGRNSILIELNPAYIEIAKKRTQQRGLFCNALTPQRK